MNSKTTEVTIYGFTLTQIHDSALSYLIRVYNPKGAIYVSKDELNSIAWEATTKVVLKNNGYVKEEKGICGLACTIAYNLLMTHLKNAERKKLIFQPLETLNRENGYYNTADAETGRKFTRTEIGAGKELDITSGEGLEIINKELDRLPKLERDIFEMYLDDVPQKEIAQICGLSYSNVRKKIHEIKKKLLRNSYINTRAHEMGLVA